MRFDKISNTALYLIALAFYVLLFFLCKGVPYFWDTVLFSSRIPQYFFENGLGNLIVAGSIDSGHPPFYSLLTLAFWKLLGQKLWVGHLLTAGFSILLAIQWIKLCRKWLAPSFVFIGLIFLFLEPTLLAQSVLVSPEIPLIAFLLWGLNNLLEKQYSLAAVAMSLMVLTSTRGTIWLFILFLFYNYSQIFIEKKRFSFKLIFPFVLPGLLSVAWLAYHYQQTGWLALNPNSNWTKYTSNAGLEDIPFNLAALFHRFVDFGRGILVLVVLILVLKYRNSKETGFFKSLSKEQKLTWAIFFFGLLVLGIIALLKTYSTQHRYYIPLYLFLVIAALQLLYKLKNQRLRNLLIAFSAAAMIAGHGLVYPDDIAQGWDSSLAFVNGLKAKKEVEAEMKALGINKQDVLTAFPFRQSDQNLYLNADTASYGNFSAEARYDSSGPYLETEKHFILWSNVCNDLPDGLRTYLSEDYFDEWRLISSSCYRNVCVELYGYD